MSAVELKPCGHCGGKAKCNELRRGNYRRVGDNYQVVCNKCRARGPLIQDSPADAIAAWNQRTDPTRDALLEALEALVVVYKRDNPMRTASAHDTGCTCMRCAVDFADAALAQAEAGK